MTGEKEKMGGWLRISTDFHQEENVISIQFRDNGEGIPPDYQKQIFNPFFTTRKKGSRARAITFPANYK